ncbi:MAG: glycosyltransferase family 1 protein [Lachnospirales bacterium]
MNEPIRVLHILQRMEAAGVQTFLMNLYRKIDRKKVQFDFLVHYTMPQFFDKEIEELGGKIYRFSVREDYNLIKYYTNLNRFFEKHKEYKIVHGHMHTLGGIYLHVAKNKNVPVRIAHSHTNNTQFDYKRFLKIIMNRLYAMDANVLFACSKAAGEYMFGTRKFEVINNAIITDNFIFSESIRTNKRKELGVEDRFVVGNVGRFEIQKNQQFVVEVFEKLCKVRSDSVLLLIGSGSMQDNIKALVIEKKLQDKVVFLGNRRDVAEIYQAMDIFFMPSLFEGLGIVGVEAQAAGTPTVCTDTLPPEIDVSPLINRVSLDAPIDRWVSEILSSAENPLKHQNMREYIVRANYDMDEVAKKMEDFYMKHYNNSGSSLV